MIKSSVEIPVNDLLKTSISDKLEAALVSRKAATARSLHSTAEMNQFGKKNPVKQSRVEVRPGIYFTQLKQKTNKDFLLYQYISIL